MGLKNKLKNIIALPYTVGNFAYQKAKDHFEPGVYDSIDTAAAKYKRGTKQIEKDIGQILDTDRDEIADEASKLFNKKKIYSLIVDELNSTYKTDIEQMLADSKNMTISNTDFKTNYGIDKTEFDDIYKELKGTNKGIAKKAHSTGTHAAGWTAGLTVAAAEVVAIAYIIERIDDYLSNHAATQSPEAYNTTAPQVQTTPEVPQNPVTSDVTAYYEDGSEAAHVRTGGGITSADVEKAFQDTTTTTYGNGTVVEHSTSTAVLTNGTQISDGSDYYEWSLGAHA